MRPDIRLPAGAEFGSSGARGAALTLVRRFLLTSAAFADNDTPCAARLDPLKGGRSAAHVFALTPCFIDDGRPAGRPVVAKIMPRAEGLREKARYDRFVRRVLPPAGRPELLASGATRTHAALWFSFVGEPDGTRFDTLTDHLQRGHTAKLQLALTGFLELVRDTWYSPVDRRRGSDISRRYLEHYFSGARSIARAESMLRADAARYFQAGSRRARHVIRDLEFPSPRAVLFGPVRKRPYASCIQHGDLNSDNLFLPGNPARVVLVDFRKTGRGHVYEDLVALEESVRINHPPGTGSGAILEIERRIALGVRPRRDDAYSRAILKVRKTAFRTFGDAEATANYHYAVAAIGLRLMHAVDLTHVARARIVASTLWAAKVLAGEPID